MLVKKENVKERDMISTVLSISLPILLIDKGIISIEELKDIIDSKNVEKLGRFLGAFYDKSEEEINAAIKDVQETKNDDK